MFEHKRVIDFIKNFQNEGTIKTFTEGCCYWFAKILDERFNYHLPESGIMYNNIYNHFSTLIDGRLYDITGEIEFTRDWVSWNYFIENDDKLVVSRIFRDCIYKIKEDV